MVEDVGEKSDGKEDVELGEVEPNNTVCIQRERKKSESILDKKKEKQKRSYKLLISIIIVLIVIEGFVSFAVSGEDRTDHKEDH